MIGRLSVAAALIACLSTSPAIAADPNQFFHQQSERASLGGYVGLSLYVVRTGKGEHAPSLRLGMGAQRLGGQIAIASAGSRRNSVVELELSATELPDLYVGGQRLSAAEGGSGWGTGKTLLVIAGVAGAVLLATQLGGSDDDDEQCLIEPELCD